MIKDPVASKRASTDAPAIPAGANVKFTAPNGIVYVGKVALRSGEDYVIEVTKGESYLVPPGKLERVSVNKEACHKVLSDQILNQIFLIAEPSIEMSNRVVVRVGFKFARPADDILTVWANKHYPQWTLVDALPRDREVGLVFEKSSAEDVKPQGGDQRTRGTPLSDEEIEGTGVIAQIQAPGENAAYGDLVEAARWILSRLNDSNPSYYAIPKESNVEGSDPYTVKLNFTLTKVAQDGSLQALYFDENGTLTDRETNNVKQSSVDGYVQVDSTGNLPLILVNSPQGDKPLQEYGFNLVATKTANYDTCVTAANEVLGTYGGYCSEAQNDFNARLTKLAVDPEAKAYWEGYFKDYGKMWVRDIPRSINKKSSKYTASDYAAYVKHENGKWCVKSESNSDWSGGCYDSKAEAEKRLQQVEMFKHMSVKACCSNKVQIDPALILDIVATNLVLADRTYIKYAAPMHGDPRYYQPVSKDGPSLRDIEETVKWSIEQASHDPEMENQIHKIVFNYLSKNPKFWQSARQTLGTNVLGPAEVPYVLAYAIRDSGRAYKQFRKMIGDWQRRWEKGQYKNLEDEAKSWRKQKDKPTKDTPSSTKVEPESTVSPAQEPPGGGASLREMENYVPPLYGSEKPEDKVPEAEEPIQEDTQDFDIDVEEPQIEQSVTPNKPLPGKDQFIQDLNDPESKVMGDVESLLDWVPYATGNNAGNSKYKYHDLPLRLILQVDPGYVQKVLVPRLAREDEDAAKALMLVLQSKQYLKNKKPVKKDKSEPDKIEPAKSEDVTARKITSDESELFGGLTISEAFKQANEIEGGTKELLKFVLSPKFRDTFLKYVEQVRPDELQFWKDKAKKMKSVASNHNVQPAKANTKFEITRMYTTSSADNHGYVFMDVGWNSDHFSSMSSGNIKHAIVSFVKGLESNKYLHDFGVMGRPKLVDFDQDSGVARIKVRCSQTNGLMMMTYSGDPEVDKV